MAGAKKKSQKQVRFLLSKGSPLSGAQKDKLKGELHRGSVKIAQKTQKKKRYMPSSDGAVKA